MKEAIVILTLMGCDHGEHNCQYVEQIAQTYHSEEACIRAAEEELLDTSDIDFPIVVADCQVQGTSFAVAESDVAPLLENDLHEPHLAPGEIEELQVALADKPKHPLVQTLDTIKVASANAVGTVWSATLKQRLR